MKINPPIISLVYLVLMVTTHLLYPVQLISSPYRYLGIVVFMIGAYFFVKARILFINTKTPIKPSDTPKFLHTLGLYGVSRNPIYLGITLAMLGIALLLATPFPFIFPFLFFLKMNFVFIPLEERNLEKVFGKKYLSYKVRVRRWI